jgi:hypothetical protein
VWPFVLTCGFDVALMVERSPSSGAAPAVVVPAAAGSEFAADLALASSRILRR